MCVCVPCWQPPCGRYGNTSPVCLVMWQMALPPISGCTVETRQRQGPLWWTCNLIMGLQHACTSYSAHRGCTKPWFSSSSYYLSLLIHPSVGYAYMAWTLCLQNRLLSISLQSEMILSWRVWAARQAFLRLKVCVYVSGRVSHWAVLQWFCSARLELLVEKTTM